MKVSIKLILIILLVINTLNSFSQPDNTVTTRGWIFFGGSFSLMFGTYTQIELSPYMGWRFTPEWWVGGGIIYQYYGSSYAYGNYSTSIYGTSLFTKYTIVRDFPIKNTSIFAYSSYEALSLENKYFSETRETGRFFTHNILIGGGLRQYLGGRASAEIQILFNVTQYKLSPYRNPTIRLGFNF